MTTIKELKCEAIDAYIAWKKYGHRFMYENYLMLGSEVVALESTLALINIEHQNLNLGQTIDECDIANNCVLKKLSRMITG